MTIDLNRFKPSPNYVLIKPDEDFETYQLNGKETGITVSSLHIENGKELNVKDRHVSVKGTVYAVPDKLIFNGDKINELRKTTSTNDIGQIKQIDALIKGSVRFDVQMEVLKGDRVVFEYKAHMDSINNGLVLNTDKGKMYLIKYDMLIMIVFDTGKPLMLNGYIQVQPEIKKLEQEDAMTYQTSASGLVLPLLKGSGQNKTRSNAYGTIVSAGSRCKGFLDFLDKCDPVDGCNEGDKILYDPRYAKNYEYEYHKSEEGQTLVRMHRKDIYGVIK